MTNKENKLDLHLFGEEAQAETDTGEQTQMNTADAGQNELETVAEEQTVQPVNEVQTEEELEKEFEALIKGGKYESVFAKRTKSIIDKRFKKYKTLEVENEELKSRLNEKPQCFNPQGEKVKKLIADRKANKLFENWIKEGKALEESYPDFNFGNELQNNEFSQMLKNGISVKNAYLALHGDEIIEQKVLLASKNAAESTLKSIRANGFRPAENGTNSQSAIVGKTDVNNLSGRDIRLILKQVENGKRVSF